ncbi:MAG: hypothetical protein R2874_08775 [Desulfobacterales bacterium]
MSTSSPFFPNRDWGTFFWKREISDDGQFRIVTVSLSGRLLPAGGESVFTGNRSYKVFKILVENGEVRSMKSGMLK